MSKYCTEDIIGFIKRSITDIARRCNVKDDEVINEIKNLYGNEN